MPYKIEGWDKARCSFCDKRDEWWKLTKHEISEHKDELIKILQKHKVSSVKYNAIKETYSKDIFNQLVRDSKFGVK